MRRHLGHAAAAVATTAFTCRVIRRMEAEYWEIETLTPRTVALLYSAYAANGTVFARAVRHRIWPIAVPSGPARLAGGALAVAGAAAAIAGASRFGSAAQLSGVGPGSLVTSGLYRYTRNPQYLGLTGLLAGIALTARSGLAAAVAGSAWVAFHRWIRSEERHLSRIFGNQYRAYMGRTRRWL
jgi:protein-S-isoprenylcysteine O-methyltransferase Ste14